MQMDKAKELRDQWGTKPCDHPSIDKEYYLGTGTGDYVCIQCGRTSPKRSDFRKEKEGN